MKWHVWKDSSALGRDSVVSKYEVMAKLLVVTHVAQSGFVYIAVILFP